MIAKTDTGSMAPNFESIASSELTCNTSRAGLLTRHFRLLGGLAFLALSATLVAQTHFCVGGDLDHMTSTDVAACKAKLSGVRDAAKRRGVPAGWHFVVVCDEAGWKDYVSFSKDETGLLSGASYRTDTRLRWTFLRGSQLDANQPQATTTAVSIALENVPNQKSAPGLVPSRSLSIAMAGSGNSGSNPQ